MDKYEDIIYIDTDTIYYYDNKGFYDLIKDFIDDLFHINEEGIFKYIFIGKKKYVQIKDVKTTEMKGFYDKWKNKDVENLAYYLYSKNNNDLTFRQFIRSSNNKDIRQPFLIKSKQIINRQKKLKRILNVK